MDNLQAARELLARKRLALVGVAREPKDFTRMVLRELLGRGYDVVPVNPAAAGSEPITDLCPYMALPRAGWLHRLHGYLRGHRH